MDLVAIVKGGERKLASQFRKHRGSDGGSMPDALSSKRLLSTPTRRFLKTRPGQKERWNQALLHWK